MMVILVSLATVISTFLGGLFALRFRDKLHLILGFSAGAVIGVAFFDLLPESISLAGASFEPALITSVAALGFLIYLVVDRFITLHFDAEENGGHSHRGNLGAGSLSLHSFLDGAAIGLAFKVSAAAGAVVATAVLVHDFSDGINTVNLILKNKGPKKQALRWLAVDALAPAAGALSASLFTLPQQYLSLFLAAFCGFFFYIGASELLPESHHGHPTMWTTVMTVLGMAVLWVAIYLAG